MYPQIEGVNIDTPMIGYSAITFIVQGKNIGAGGAHGSEDVRIARAGINALNNLLKTNITIKQ